MRLLVALSLMAAMACSVDQASTANRTQGGIRASSPTGSQARIVVLQPGGTSTKSILTIADLSGHVLARASFDPMPRPRLGNAADILPAQVRLTAGAAYYAEPSGRIHRLDPGGKDAVVATFPLTTTQQELSFAVSPDGKQLIAIVLTAPEVHDPPPQDLTQPFFKDGSRWSTELEHASLGGATESVLKNDLGPANGPLSSITSIAGWDEVGPVALLDTVDSTQSALPSLRMPGSALVHLGSDGTHLDQLGGSSCHPLDELPNGATLCYTGQTYEVRSASGQLIWKQDLGGGFFYNPVLSPDGRRIAAQSAQGNALFTQGATPASVARQSPQQLSNTGVGWVTADTLAIEPNAGAPASVGGPVQLLSVSDLQHPRDTGLIGLFLGTL